MTETITKPTNISIYNDVTFQWYDVISIILIVTVILLSSVCLFILLKYRHVLKVLRFKFIWMVFISTISEFVFRLIYELCYHIPSLAKENVLCWTIELFTEISSMATYTWILILVAYYSTLTFNKIRDPGKKCRYFAWIFGFVWPTFLPVLIFPGLTLAPYFHDINSCWRGDISLIIEIFNFVMKLFILIGVISEYLICIYCRYTPEFLHLLAGVVSNVRGKTNLVALFFFMATLSHLPIGLRVFYHKHDTIVVLGYFVKGLFTDLCFCFLDSDVQRVLYPNRNRDKLRDDDVDMMNVDPNVNLRQFGSNGYSYPYAFADMSTRQHGAGLPYKMPERNDKNISYVFQNSEPIDEMKIERV